MTTDKPTIQEALDVLEWVLEVTPYRQSEIDLVFPVYRLYHRDYDSYSTEQRLQLTQMAALWTFTAVQETPLERWQVPEWVVSFYRRALAEMGKCDAERLGEDAGLFFSVPKD